MWLEYNCTAAAAAPGAAAAAAAAVCITAAAAAARIDVNAAVHIAALLLCIQLMLSGLTC